MSGMKDMTQGSVTRHLLHMASFMAVSMVVQTLYLLADLYWVGRLGKEAIAAVGLSGNLMMLVVALTQMLGVGTTTVISHAAGRKDQKGAELAFNQSIILSLFVAAIFGLCSFPFRTKYGQSLSADALTASLAASYLLWFIPALMIQFPLVALGSALRATGIIKPAVGLQVLSVILNMIFAPLLIFGVGPFPKMGVAGAALATFLSILIANILTIIYFEKSFRYLRFRASHVAPAGQDLVVDASDRSSCWRGVRADGGLHRRCLCHHPRLRRGRPGGVRRRGAGHAGDVPAGNCRGLRGRAGGRPEFWRPARRSGAPVILFGPWNYLRPHGVANSARAICSWHIHPRFFERPERDQLSAVNICRSSL